MTLDEAIKHAEEVADSDCYNDKQFKCADEHRQLAEWLKDYKRMKEQEPTTKNDLGVDCISRQAVLEGIAEWIADGYADSEADCSHISSLVTHLPSVTPQEPQIFKWCTDCKEYDQEKHCCHRWSKVIRDTVEEMKQEQEPKPMVEIDLYSVIKQKYIEREVLDKIRAEIEQTVSRYSISRERGGMGQVEWSDRLIKESEVLQILDKYKAETEAE